MDTKGKEKFEYWIYWTSLQVRVSRNHGANNSILLRGYERAVKGQGKRLRILTDGCDDLFLMAFSAAAAASVTLIRSISPVGDDTGNQSFLRVPWHSFFYLSIYY